MGMSHNHKVNIEFIKNGGEKNSQQITFALSVPVLIEDTAIFTKTSFAPMFFTSKDIEEKNVVVLGRVVELRVKF